MQPIELKSKRQAAQTIAEWGVIDRGFLRRSHAAIITIIVIAAAIIGWWVVLIVAVGVLIADFIFFCRRRSRTLKRYNSGTPRLMASGDFAAASAAFEKAGVPEPTMADWEEAAGFKGRPDWRVDMRYTELIRSYARGDVADIGCSDGRLLWRYKICPADRYVGLDTGLDLIRQLRRKTGAPGIVATAEQTGLATGSVDFVACTEVFEHLPNPRAAITEFDRILRPGGRVVIQSPNASRIRNFNPLHVACCILGLAFPTILMRKVVQENTFVRAFTYHWDFTRQDIAAYVRGSNFKVSKLTAATYHFNPQGSTIHRIAHWISRLPFVCWAWDDMLLVLDK